MSCAGEHVCERGRALLSESLNNGLCAASHSSLLMWATAAQATYFWKTYLWHRTTVCLQAPAALLYAAVVPEAAFGLSKTSEKSGKSNFIRCPIYDSKRSRNNLRTQSSYYYTRLYFYINHSAKRFVCKCLFELSSKCSCISQSSITNKEIWAAISYRVSLDWWLLAGNMPCSISAATLLMMFLEYVKKQANGVSLTLITRWLSSEKNHLMGKERERTCMYYLFDSFIFLIRLSDQTDILKLECMNTSILSSVIIFDGKFSD